ncbi:MAG TPA: bifunctional proline dehydrogenase/L-glutamate gamma-semialdehyde dehydrogenase, partial [Luteolibacter sp.]|nr:bifunctional proline dehydrogenase/L-glutamate gamma-semialdehyde dehydrogenase [Luteolibacter sp.]
MNEIPQAAIVRATALLETSLKSMTRKESSRIRRVARLIQDPAAKTLSMVLTDRLFRSRNAARASAGFRHSLQDFGATHGFSWIDRMALKLASAASHLVPSIVLKAMRQRLREESAEVILPAEEEGLSSYLWQRRQSAFRVNLNQLGEAILGEEEAKRRLEAILALLARGDVSYISVKISAIFSQINLLAWDNTMDQLCERLRRLYRAALPKGKMVNLDMEEYRDLALTLAAMRHVLDEPEFHGLRTGVVLQAYLPDSWSAQQELTTWAKARVAAGGAPIKLRLVKGANHAMESVEAELHGWNVAPYTSKADTDANFKRMLEFACQAENAQAVHLGVGSHNLLDIALALVLRERNGVADRVEIEMLEGMANHQARAVADDAGQLLFYAPIVKKDDFGSALAYLIRRLDENTSPQNFLHDLFDLTPDSRSWRKQTQLFLDAWSRRHSLEARSHRASLPQPRPEGFHNEPDSDWTQAKRRDALASTLQTWRSSPPPAAADLDAVLQSAAKAQPAWEALGDGARAAVLQRCAEVIATQRDAAIACLRLHGKKAIPEADAEISEAIDFARYYALQTTPQGMCSSALGIVAITPPWNFPYAIPCGGVLAALMAGNAVILKPAPEVVEIAWLLAQQLWQAGVPREVLHFFPCPDGETGKALICDPRVKAVVLTGAYETARLFQSWRPSL